MSNPSPRNEWIVTVDGTDRRVVAERDDESGRVQIRIDGRMAARPLGAHETERRFTIGETGYLLQRDASGELLFDLDPDAPLPRVAPPAYKRAEPAEKPPRRMRRVVIGAIVTLLLLPAVRWTLDAIRYMRVPWEVYTAPGRQFRIAFPGEPEETSDEIKVGEVVARTVKLETRHHNHMYILEWLEFPFVIPPEAEGEVITGAINAMVKSEGAKLIQSGWSTAAHRDSMHFVMHMPDNEDWSGGTARGHAVRFRNRLYIQYAYVPRGESLGYDVGEYLRSFDLPEE